MAMTMTPLTLQAVYEDGTLHPLQPLHLVEHQRVTLTLVAQPEATQPTPSQEALARFERVLDRLEAIREEVEAGYEDVARRECAWRTLQRVAAGPLWEQIEDLESEPHRRQLADVLDAAVSRLRAFQLSEEHFSALDLTLARLAAPRVTEQDVDFCENQWRAAGVDTIPSLGEAFEEWLTLSGLDFPNAE